MDLPFLRRCLRGFLRRGWADDLAFDGPSILVKVRQPSGTMAFEEELGLHFKVKDVLWKLSAAGFGSPARMTLLRGSEKLTINASLADVGLIEGEELLLIRGRGNYTYTRCQSIELCNHWFRIMLLGSTESGKSSFLNQATRSTFDPVYVTTIGVDFANCKFHAEGFGTLRLQMLDTSGQERFRVQTISHCRRNCDAYLVFFNRTRRETFDVLPQFLRDANSMGFRRPEMVIAIIGTHTDLQAVVSSEEAKEFADSCGASYHEVCCADETSVNQAVFSILDQLLESELELNREKDGASLTS